MRRPPLPVPRLLTTAFSFCCSYFALAVYVKPFSGKVMSVWVYAAALVKRDAIMASGRVLGSSAALLSSSSRSELGHQHSFHSSGSKNSSPAPPALSASASFAGRGMRRG